MGHAEALGHLLLVVVQVHADDHVRAGQPQALDHVQANAAQAEHDRLGADLDLGGVDHRADSGGHAAADIADLVKGRVLADLGHRDFRQHRVVGKRRAAHVVADHRAVGHGKARGAVRHQALALGGADAGAQVGLARQAGRAFAAFGGVERDHVVARLDGFHARADLDHHACALVAQDGREQAFGIVARAGELVGVADAGGLDLDHHLALFRAFEVDLHHFQRAARLQRYGGTGFHRQSPIRSDIPSGQQGPQAAPVQLCSFFDPRGQAASAPDRLATWVAMASISGGDSAS